MPTTSAQDPFDEGSRLRALRALFDDPRAILVQVGAMLLSATQAAFVEERFGNVKWKDRGQTRMNPNWPAVLVDLAGGGKPKARRFEDRPVLTDNGLLRKSFAMRIASADTVEVGTMLPYGDILHAGKQSKSVTITKGIQERLWAWIQEVASSLRRSESAPGKREDREARQAVKSDPALGRIKSDLAQSMDAYRGRSVPKAERERRNGLRAQIKARAAEVEGKARKASVGITAPEAGRITAARKMAAGAEALKWLLNPHLRGTQRTIKHPARPMVGLPADLVSRIERVVGVVVGAA